MGNSLAAFVSAGFNLASGPMRTVIIKWNILQREKKKQANRMHSNQATIRQFMDCTPSIRQRQKVKKEKKWKEMWYWKTTSHCKYLANIWASLYQNG